MAWAAPAVRSRVPLPGPRRTFSGRGIPGHHAGRERLTQDAFIHFEESLFVIRVVFPCCKRVTSAYPPGGATRTVSGGLHFPFWYQNMGRSDTP